MMMSSVDLTAEGQDYENAFVHTPIARSPSTMERTNDPKKKRNAICDAFYPVLVSSPAHLLSSITCLCTYSPPRMSIIMMMRMMVNENDDD